MLDLRPLKTRTKAAVTVECFVNNNLGELAENWSHFLAQSPRTGDSPPTHHVYFKPFGDAEKNVLKRQARHRDAHP